MDLVCLLIEPDARAIAQRHKNSRLLLDLPISRVQLHAFHLKALPHLWVDQHLQILIRPRRQNDPCLRQVHSQIGFRDYLSSAKRGIWSQILVIIGRAIFGPLGNRVAFAFRKSPAQARIFLCCPVGGTNQSKQNRLNCRLVLASCYLYAP